MEDPVLCCKTYVIGKNAAIPIHEDDQKTSAHFRRHYVNSGFRQLLEKSCTRIFFLPAQLAPVNPVLQVQVPVEASQVPWPEQSSGQVRSL